MRTWFVCSTLVTAFVGFALSGCSTPPQSLVSQTTPEAASGKAQNAVPISAHSDSDAMTIHSDLSKVQFTSAPSVPSAGQAVTWTFRFTNLKSGKAVTQFQRVHEKLMHLIVVSKDFSFFIHIHPVLGKDGTFSIRAALPRAGEYSLYCDFTPQGGQHEVVQQSFKVAGSNPLPSSAKLVPDTMRGMWMTRRVRAHDEGRDPVQGAAEYEVALMPMPEEPRAGEMAMLHFQIRDAEGKPVTDLQPYMGAMGHGVILSADGKTYLHVHPMEGGEKMDDMKDMKMDGADSSHQDDMDMKGMTHSLPANTRGGPNVIFHTEFPAAGLYKAWGQFMHKGKIIDAPFVLRVLPAQ